MSLADVRRRLPVVASLPTPDNRWMPQEKRVKAGGPRGAVWELR